MKYRVRIARGFYDSVLVYVTPEGAGYEKAYAIRRGYKVDDPTVSPAYGKVFDSSTDNLKEMLEHYQTALLVSTGNPLQTWEVKCNTPSA